MIQEDIRKLVANLIASNALSSSFSEKFNSTIQSESFTPFKEASSRRTIVGIYYLYLFQLFNEKTKKKLANNEQVIDSSVEKFNTNAMSSEEAKRVLDDLITQNTVLKISFENRNSNENILPYSTTKNTIEIEKMFEELVKLSLLESSEIKGLFLSYFDKFEKNKDILKAFEQNERLTSTEFTTFLESILLSLDKQDTLIDSKEFNESFITKLTTLFENYFSKFKETEIAPLNFNIKIEKMLGDKNNESYFFYGDELEDLDQQIQQPYVSQLEINSKINTSTVKSSLSNQESIWEMVGAIVENPIKKGIGIARYPYIDKNNNNKVFISVTVEQEIDLSDSDNFYHQIRSMRISQVSDRTDSRRRLVVDEISESLDLPRELALYPSIIEEYLVRNKGVSIDFEIQKKILRYEFYPVQEVVFDKLNGIITVPDDLEPITSHESFILLPSPRRNFIVDKNVSLANERTIGKTTAEFTLFESWYVLIELDLPSTTMIDKISIKLRKSEKDTNDLWKLRFTISKVLDIFEAESLLPENLWKYIWHEKIPIFPFTLLTSFLGIAPSGSVNKETISNESIQLARGIDVESINALLQDGPYVILSEQKITIGKAISFYYSPVDKQIYLIYCDINEVDILKKLNRDTSQSSLVKLSKRVTKALGLKSEKLEEILHPRYLLTYILFYSIQLNPRVDFTNIHDIIHWLIGEFEMKYCPIEQIKGIDTENYIIQVDL